jgi:hypothetical protein
MKGLVIRLVAFMGIALFFYSCSNNPTSPSGTGILQVSMTDAPASYDSVNIYIDSVQAHIANGDTIQGWFTLNNKPEKYDLKTLVNGATTIIGSDTLPVGRYSQIRLFIGSGSYIVVNGVPYSLTIPSGVQTGLKLNVDANLQDGFLYNITLDFDANMSIVVSGTLLNPQYILKPVIRSGASATTGIITGTVSPGTVSSNVWAITGTDSSSTSTDATGGFRLIYLNQGTYDVVVAPEDTTYRDTTITNVAVSAGSTTNIGTVTLTHK